MLIKSPKGWEIPERLATPEDVAMNRRAFIAGAGAIAGAAALPDFAFAAPDPTASLYPGPRNKLYTLSRPITPERVNSRFNNFYEFGSTKKIFRAAQKLQIRPWQIQIDGMVEQPITIDFDDLIRKMSVEERLYRHRCVEAWSMTVPWSGFPMRDLVAFAKPLSSAKYVRMETFEDPSVAKGQRQFWYPWPYVEGITIEEANNDLAFMVTGAYGKPLAKQFGAPIRLALPWKYGFKSIKSIMRISFTDERPKSFWEEILPKEYGFWANVNPKVRHPRWSQATERVLGTNEEIPTQLYNGYGKFVASLYTDKKKQRLYY